MKRRKVEINLVGVLAIVAGVAATIMAWEFPNMVTALSVGWLVLTGVVSRFPWLGPRETPVEMNELRRSSIDECASGRDAGRVINHVCSRAVRAADQPFDHVEVK